MRGLVLCILCILLVSGCANERDGIYYSDLILNDMQPIVEVVEYLYANPPHEESITKKMEFVVYGKVLALKAIDSGIERLNGRSIKGMCAVISLSREKEFGSSIADNELTQLVKGYLEAVAPRVKAKAAMLMKTVFTDSDCAI